jgi:hypothetical protein
LFEAPAKLLFGLDVATKVSGASFEVESAIVPAGEKSAALYEPGCPGKSIAVHVPLKVQVVPFCTTASQVILRSEAAYATCGKAKIGAMTPSVRATIVITLAICEVTVFVDIAILKFVKFPDI